MSTVRAHEKLMLGNTKLGCSTSRMRSDHNFFCYNLSKVKVLTVKNLTKRREKKVLP